MQMLYFLQGRCDNHRMPLRKFIFSAALLGLLTVTVASGQTAAISTDPPPDKSAPASMVQLSVPSHGENLLGVFYLAEGSGLHPTAIVMHGFPGYEQNLDIAQALRRAGWNVMAVHYRGSWGVKGNFSFAHVTEDADAEVAFLLDPAIQAKYRIDANRIALVGHSMGGFAVASAGAHNPRVAAVVMISAWNIAGPFATFVQGQTKNDLAPLAGCTAETLGHEVFQSRATLNFLSFASALASRPVTIITSDDGLTPDNDKLLSALEKAGDRHAKGLHIATDHSYSDHRIALQQAVLDALEPTRTR
jgi:pimeloyl-ACP methyl ester carboxylesterase